MGERRQRKVKGLEAEGFMSDERKRRLGALVGLGSGILAALLVIFVAADAWEIRQVVYGAAAVALGIGTLANYLAQQYLARRWRKPR